MNTKINAYAENFAKSTGYLLTQYHNLCIVNSITPEHRVVIWKGSRKIPIYSLSFSCKEEETRFINCIKEKYDKELQRKEALKKEKQRKQKAFAEGLIIGDIMVSSWGYDQTNVNYYQVLAKKGQSVVIQEISKKVTETGFMCGEAIPMKDHFIREPEKRKIGAEYIRINRFDSCRLWDGNPEYCSWYA